MLEDFEKEFLTLTVGETTLELLPMGDLPALRVMDMLNTKEEKLEKALALMALASKNVKQFEIEREFMSFNELINLLDLWMEQSSKHSTKQKRKLDSSGGGKTKRISLHTGPDSTPSEIVEAIGRAIESLIPDLTDSDEGEMTISLGEDDFDEIRKIINSSGLDFENDTPSRAVIKAAMWFVANGKEDLLVTKGLLIGPNRNGKFYPVVEGVVKRRLGFTRDEAEMEFGTNEQ